MMPRMVVLFGCLARLALAQAPACQVLDSGRVLGKHLAAALPEFAVIPPEVVMATMPPPGNTRTIHSPEIASLAQRYSVKLAAAPDVCFAWAMEPLDRARVLEVMQAAFAGADVQIEVVETSLPPVPKGRLEFSRARLTAPPASQRGPVVWPGEVIYADNQRFPVWARVKVTAPCTRLVANQPLRTGQLIRPEQVRTVSETCFPTADSAAPSPALVSGLVPLRPISAGGEIRQEWLAPPNEINRGDSIDVEVYSGAARLALSGKAESSGHMGDVISVRNLTSNRVFQARVSGKGKAVVQADGVRVN